MDEIIQKHHKYNVYVRILVYTFGKSKNRRRLLYEEDKKLIKINYEFLDNMSNLNISFYLRKLIENLCKNCKILLYPPHLEYDPRIFSSIYDNRLNITMKSIIIRPLKKNIRDFIKYNPNIKFINVDYVERNKIVEIILNKKQPQIVKDLFFQEKLPDNPRDPYALKFKETLPSPVFEEKRIIVENLNKLNLHGINKAKLFINSLEPEIIKINQKDFHERRELTQINKFHYFDHACTINFSFKGWQEFNDLLKTKSNDSFLNLKSTITFKEKIYKIFKEYLSFSNNCTELLSLTNVTLSESCQIISNLFIRQLSEKIIKNIKENEYDYINVISFVSDLGVYFFPFK